ncbi:hypothetical protein SAY86_028903 [Trapa natans]|uniref:Phospholipid/glycerol acyltransferase domain-containing protein n=1 Tax=Trapa natans TaxID=22666 RepID=A0AAN7RB76_TRANT|nr:hypothetical protein SAY86_028903 [Trapa natans]
MVFFPVVILKLAYWLLCQLLPSSCHRAARKFSNHGFLLKSPASFKTQIFSNVSKFSLDAKLSESSDTAASACDISAALLRSGSLFPYFMLVAFEAGGIIRALLLLLCSPILPLLHFEGRLRLMIFVTFCGLRVNNVESVARAVMPKFFLEDLSGQAYDALASARGGKFIVTAMPRVVVEWFLKDYLSIEMVTGTELHRISGQYFSGLVSSPGLAALIHRWRTDVSLRCSGSHPGDPIFMHLCVEEPVKRNVTTTTASTNATLLPRDKYPKPLIFHDGRLAFLPTPPSMLAMFMFMPLGVILAIFRLSIGIFLPYKLSILLAAMSGLKIRAKGFHNMAIRSSTAGDPARGGVLYVCTHRTLLDPIFLTTCMAQSLTAVTYSLSRFSEIISPILTVRLTRDTARDSKTMRRLLSEGDLVICPEGTTCREPYLLRFSSLFAELAHDIVPVAVNAEVTMFYGTTARGLKCLDPVFFLMNPRPAYYVNQLGRIPREMTCEGGRSRHEVANGIQKRLADALGFECTDLTRRDKYMMLAGNEGIVKEPTKRKLFEAHTTF